MLAAILLLALTTDNFLSPRNLRNVGTQVPVNAILAAGMTVVILSGGIDLSVGSVHALAGVAAARLLVDPGLNRQFGDGVLPVAVAGGIAVGLALGAVNGGAVAGIGIPPFIVTLAMMRIARGLAKHVTDGVPVGLQGPENPLSEAINGRWLQFRELGLGYAGGIVPNAFLIAVAVTALLALLLGRTRWGRQVYAVGGSERTAHLSGVPVRRLRLSAYVLMGALAGLTGAMEASSLQSGSPVTGEGYELNAIAAVVVGGARLTGGQGSVVASFCGAVLVIGLMNNALNLRNVPPFWQEVATGAIILSVALVDRFTRGKQDA